MHPFAPVGFVAGVLVLVAVVSTLGSTAGDRLPVDPLGVEHVTHELLNDDGWSTSEGELGYAGSSIGGLERLTEKDEK